MIDPLDDVSIYDNIDVDNAYLSEATSFPKYCVPLLMVSPRHHQQAFTFQNRKGTNTSTSAKTCPRCDDEVA